MSQREELIRLARESGLPVSDEATLTEVIEIISAEPMLGDELAEALNHILGTIEKTEKTAHT